MRHRIKLQIVDEAQKFANWPFLFVIPFQKKNSQLTPDTGRFFYAEDIFYAEEISFLFIVIDNTLTDT